MKIEIKHWLTGSVLFEGDFSCLKECVESAVRNGASLNRASLNRASLDGASLVGASLVGASLNGASLVGARLVGASLVGASLDGARLDGARLDGASLNGALRRYAQIAFTGHGECGRMLTAIQLKKGGKIEFFCGCFMGDEKKLRKYIKDGAAHLRKTRTLALETVLTLIAAENDKPL